jgi:hypothetical protein
MDARNGDRRGRAVTLDYEGHGGSDSDAGPTAATPDEQPPVVAPAESLEADESTSTPDENGTRRQGLLGTVSWLVRLVQSSDEKAVQEAVLSLSRSRRWLAPLALIAGAFLMLFQGLKTLFVNWRLTLVQVLPAMWIWVAMLDIKLHVLHGKQFHIVRGPVLIPLALAVTALTAGSFFLNAVFAFAVTAPRSPEIRPAFRQAHSHLGAILAWGIGVGLALSYSSLISARWGTFSFVLTQGIVVGIMMVCYVAVPSRIVGMPKRVGSRRDKLAATAVGGAVGAVVCSPPYMLGRLGILMLGWHYLFWLGVVLIVIGVALQTGVTSAVKAVKMSVKLVGDPTLADADADA